MTDTPFDLTSRSARLKRHAFWTLACCLSLGIASSFALAQGQAQTASLATRADLTEAAAAAEHAASNGSSEDRSKNALLAAAIRRRLVDGDMQVGDRVVVTVVSDAVRRDTLVVRSDRRLELSGSIVVPVAGALRSELQERVSTEVLKYVKAQRIDVTPLLRVGILGAVVKPGYFAVASDIPLTDAIMGAGGPTSLADLERSVVRRRSQEFRSAEETGKAISGGLTLDQFGLMAGDELVVGQKRPARASAVLGSVGALASVLALVVALRR